MTKRFLQCLTDNSIMKYITLQYLVLGKTRIGLIYWSKLINEEEVRKNSSKKNYRKIFHNFVWQSFSMIFWVDNFEILAWFLSPTISSLGSLKTSMKMQGILSNGKFSWIFLCLVSMLFTISTNLWPISSSSNSKWSWASFSCKSLTPFICSR